MSESEIKWEHLGDGVYAGYDGFGVWLHTSVIIDMKSVHRAELAIDKIYLEPPVLEALDTFVRLHKGGER